MRGSDESNVTPTLTPCPLGAHLARPTESYVRIALPESVHGFLSREYNHLTALTGRDFFLGLGSYVRELDGRAEIHEILSALKTETDTSLGHFVEEQNGFVEEARKVRADLAERAPEIDNSDLEKPDERTHAYTAWDLDSFARFDDLVERDKTAEIGYPLLPDAASSPGVVSRLLQILRGRLQAAEYGEEASGNGFLIRRFANGEDRRRSRERS